MKHIHLNHHSKRGCAVVRAWAAAGLSLCTTACDAAQRFESAVADESSAIAEHQPTRWPSEGDAAAETATGSAPPPSLSGSPAHFETSSGSSAPPTADAAIGEPAAGQTTSASQPDVPDTRSTVGSEAPPTDDAPSSHSASDATSRAAPPPSAPSQETSEPAPLDECPEHETQLVAGSCGCGHAPEPKCETLRAALSHRYSFVSHAAQEGYDEATIPDSIGGADGAIHDAEFDWDGSLLLNGQNGYVELPAGLLSAYDEATLDLWLKWWGGGDNQRVLNFGVSPKRSSDAPDNYLSITPSGSNGVVTVQYRTGAAQGVRLEADDRLKTSDLQHITVVLRPQSLSLFVNGSPEATVETPHRLTKLTDDDNWLGRALYSGYPLYQGAFFEFRVFSRALSDDEVAKLNEVGLALP